MALAKVPVFADPPDANTGFAAFAPMNFIETKILTALNNLGLLPSQALAFGTDFADLANIMPLFEAGVTEAIASSTAFRDSVEITITADGDFLYATTMGVMQQTGGGAVTLNGVDALRPFGVTSLYEFGFGISISVDPGVANTSAGFVLNSSFDPNISFVGMNRNINTTKFIARGTGGAGNVITSTIGFVGGGIHHCRVYRKSGITTFSVDNETPQTMANNLIGGTDGVFMFAADASTAIGIASYLYTVDYLYFVGQRQAS